MLDEFSEEWISHRLIIMDQIARYENAQAELKSRAAQQARQPPQRRGR